jgi:hypothetical protein
MPYSDQIISFYSAYSSMIGAFVYGFFGALLYQGYRWLRIIKWYYKKEYYEQKDAVKKRFISELIITTIGSGFFVMVISISSIAPVWQVVVGATSINFWGKFIPDHDDLIDMDA